MKKLPILVFIVLFILLSSSNADVTVIVGGQAASGGDTVSFVAYASAPDDTSDTHVCSKPAGTTDGDRMVASISIDTEQTGLTPPSGWTQIDHLYQSGLDTFTYYKDASSEGDSYTWTMDPAAYAAVHILTFRKTGGTWADPTAAGYHSIAGDSNTSITTSSVTATDGSALACFFGNDGDLDVSTPPVSMTATTTQDGSCCMSQAAYYQTSMSAGAVTKSITWSGTDGITAAAVVVGLQ